MKDRIEFTTRVLRKDESLPRYIVIPGQSASALALEATTGFDVAINGTPIGRRNVKRWSRSHDAWFLELTARQCRDAGIDTGDRVRIAIARADDGLPAELSELLWVDPDARAAWNALTPSRRRMLADHVRAAKRPDTRRRRAEQAVGR